MAANPQKSPVTVTRKSKQPQIMAAVEKMKKMRVYVGIPRDKAYDNPAHPDINNAELLFIHTHGSPLQNIPARPVLEPAIKADGNHQKISRGFEKAARATLRGDEAQALMGLKEAGLAAQIAAQAWFRDPRNGWAPDSDETIARKLGKLSPQAQEKALRAIEKAGGDTSGIVTTLVDSGNMRKAITFVVKEG